MNVLGMIVSIFVFAAVSAAQVIYDNGDLSTGATSRSGVAAPAGTTWSELQSDVGNLTESNTTLGVGCQVVGAATNNRCADNFVIPAGQTFSITGFRMFAYQTGATGPASPFVGATLRIWNGEPGAPGSVIVFGDTTTNRLTSSTNSNIFRTGNTTVPAPAVPGTTRIIWQNDLSVSPTLVLPSGGNYWVDFQFDAGANGNFTPVRTPVGARSFSLMNGRQSIAAAAFLHAIDTGNPATAPDYFQEFPFKLLGTVSGTATPVRRILDFDGDGKTDLAIARSASAAGQTTWIVQNSTGGGTSGTAWGLGVGFAGADVPTPADFDGDGKTDVAVWRPGAALTARFFILNSATSTVSIAQFGQTGDDPSIVGDYDGDGKADVAVYRAGANGTFFYRGTLNNAGGATTFIPWGTTGDIALPGDANGDGKNDFMIVRNQGGNMTHWRLTFPGGVQPVITFGLPGDKFVSGDFDGDRRVDIAAVRSNAGGYNWHVLGSSAGAYIAQTFGASATDYLTPGDYDGDGRTDISVWRSGAGADSGFFFDLPTARLRGANKWGSSAGTLTSPDYPVANFTVK